MYFITIDCGTTNSRVYVVDDRGSIISKATRHVGVRNTSMTGSRKCLEDGLREAVTEAIEASGIATVNASYDVIDKRGKLLRGLGYGLAKRLNVEEIGA